MFFPKVIVTLLTALAVRSNAKQCAAFDQSGSLYLFGGASDVNLGQSSTWGSPNPTTLTTTGRPPWTGNNTICLKGGYVDVLYVFDADSANPGDIYLYSFSTSSWSTQKTTSPPNLSSGSTILDHDTNVVFSLPGGSSSMYTLDLGSLATATAAGSSAIAWEAVSSPNFSVDRPVMSQASQHIVFFGVPANPAGSANVFVVHYSYFQPEVQAFALANGATTNFPSTHGVAIGVPASDTSAGTQMIFVPDDFSGSYLATHWTNPSDYSSTADAPSGINSYINSTQTLPAPSTRDTGSAYAASPNTLVQLTSSGDVYYLSNFVNSYAASTSATWQQLNYNLAGISGAAGSTVASGSATASSTGAGSSAASGSMTRSMSASGGGSSTRSGTGTQTASAAATSSGAATQEKKLASGALVGGVVMLLAAMAI